MLHETHIVGHMKLEITEAEVKQEKEQPPGAGEAGAEDDEDKKREERVEERRGRHRWSRCHLWQHRNVRQPVFMNRGFDR
eukprot:Skav202950  [mRNA]  locus=scaffold422:625962:626927:+ [translate_table: standard]